MRQLNDIFGSWVASNARGTTIRSQSRTRHVVAAVFGFGRQVLPAEGHCSRHALESQALQPPNLPINWLARRIADLHVPWERKAQHVSSRLPRNKLRNETPRVHFFFFSHPCTPAPTHLSAPSNLPCFGPNPLDSARPTEPPISNKSPASTGRRRLPHRLFPCGDF